MENYELEKSIWTEADFEKMGWHDCRIYKIRLTDDLEMDIDYILKWNKPEIEGLPFTFWVAPATLVFKEVKILTFEIDTAFSEAIEIEDIEREMTDTTTHWTILTHQGDFEFSSNGYLQFIRQAPIFQFGQTISFLERAGFSLDRITNQKNPNILRNDIIEQKEKDLEHFENVKKRHLKRKEYEELQQARERNEIELKGFLIKKKAIKEMLDYYDYWLKGTRFEDY